MGFIKRRARKARQRVRRRAHDALRGAAQRYCPECQKRVDPFHTCAPRSDFTKRKAGAERQRKTEQRRQRRNTAKGKSAPQTRERQPHPYETCTDQNCPRPTCKAFKEGMEACPLEHAGN